MKTLLKKTSSEFTKQVVIWIKKIPKGKVATYGQIAALAGKPHASRGVAWILNSSSNAYQLPWHRVLGSKGKISFVPGSRNFLDQKRRLEKEGIEIDRSGATDLKRFQWNKKPSSRKSRIGQPKMFGP